MSNATGAGWRPVPTGSPGTGSTLHSWAGTRSVAPHSPTARCCRMSCGTRRYSSMPATPIMTSVWTVGCVSFPDHDQLPGLRSDYDAMRAARVVGPEAPEFDVLIEQIRSVESDANRRT